MEVTVLGAKIFTLFGNLKDGVVGEIDLFVAKGKITFFLKNGNELWVKVELEITFDGTFETEAKILEF